MATVQPPVLDDREYAHRRVTAIGWGVLFMWVGIATLTQVGWGYGLIGVAVVILGSQAVHQFVGGVRLDVFSVVVGLLFLAGGIWELFSLQVALVPVICLVAGAALVISSLTSRPAH